MSGAAFAAVDQFLVPMGENIGRKLMPLAAAGAFESGWPFRHVGCLGSGWGRLRRGAERGALVARPPRYRVLPASICRLIGRDDAVQPEAIGLTRSFSPLPWRNLMSDTLPQDAPIFSNIHRAYLEQFGIL